MKFEVKKLRLSYIATFMNDYETGEEYYKHKNKLIIYENYDEPSQFFYYNKFEDKIDYFGVGSDFHNQLMFEDFDMDKYLQSTVF